MSNDNDTDTVVGQNHRKLNFKIQKLFVKYNYSSKSKSKLRFLENIKSKYLQEIF